MSKANIPIQIQEVINQYLQLQSRIDEINKAASELKEKMGYKQTYSNLSDFKDTLYQYMVDNNLKHVGMGTKNRITLAKVKPASAKKEDREIKLTARIEDALEDSVGHEEAQSLAPVVLEAVIKRS